MWRVCKTDWRTGWVRIIFAEGPRVVINALTFISITHTDAIIRNGPDALGFFAKLGANIEALYDENKYQVMILGTMAFTSLVWIIAVIRLLLSALIYLCYLFHSIKGGQSLYRYCRMRIDDRMGEIVKKKHDKALRKEKAVGPGILVRQPTIPTVAWQKGAPPADPYAATAKLVDGGAPPGRRENWPPEPALSDHDSGLPYHSSDQLPRYRADDFTQRSVQPPQRGNELAQLQPPQRGNGLSQRSNEHPQRGNGFPPRSNEFPPRGNPTPPRSNGPPPRGNEFPHYRPNELPQRGNEFYHYRNNEPPQQYRNNQPPRHGNPPPNRGDNPQYRNNPPPNHIRPPPNHIRPPPNHINAPPNHNPSQQPRNPAQHPRGNAPPQHRSNGYGRSNEAPQYHGKDEFPLQQMPPSSRY